MYLKKIISGGQTGADEGGLIVQDSWYGEEVVWNLCSGHDDCEDGEIRPKNIMVVVPPDGSVD